MGLLITRSMVVLLALICIQQSCQKIALNDWLGSRELHFDQHHQSFYAAAVEQRHTKNQESNPREGANTTPITSNGSIAVSAVKNNVTLGTKKEEAALLDLGSYEAIGSDLEDLRGDEDIQDHAKDAEAATQADSASLLSLSTIEGGGLSIVPLMLQSHFTEGSKGGAARRISTRSMNLLEENHKMIANGQLPFIALGESYKVHNGSYNAESQRPQTGRTESGHDRMRKKGASGITKGMSYLGVDRKPTIAEDAVKKDISQKHSVGSKAITALHKRQIKVPIFETRDSQHIAHIDIGNPPQRFRLLFDTGSGNMWVVGKNCHESSCTKVHQFDPGVSKTFKRINPENFLTIFFATGEISGRIGEDSVGISNLMVQNQRFGVIDTEKGKENPNIFDRINFEGIIGLSFSEMNSMGGNSFFDNLVQQGGLKKKEFSFYVAHSSPVSAILFGGTSEMFFHPPLEYVKVVKEHYWQTRLDELWVGNKRVCCNERSFLIFDSGTTFNTVPHDELHSILSMMPKRDCTDGTLEGIKDYPDVRYIVEGKTITLKPDQYMVVDNDGYCKPLYMQVDVPKKYGKAYILGMEAFMRHYYTAFLKGDKGKPSMVGFARARHSTENTQLLESLSKKSSTST